MGGSRKEGEMMTEKKAEKLLEVVNKKVGKLLDQLAGFRQARQGSTNEINDVINQALRNCPDLKNRYDELQEGIKFFVETESELTSQVQEEVLRVAASIKGGWLQAVYSEGKTTWDTKLLEGYLIAHPELAALKKEGKPSVSIREIKNQQGES